MRFHIILRLQPELIALLILPAADFWRNGLADFEVNLPESPLEMRIMQRSLSSNYN